MAKVIPEIYISNVDQTELLESPEACSEGLTDNEMLQCPADSEGDISNNKDEVFSDLEISSTEEELTPYQPVEVLSSDFNIGNTSEKLINVHSPGKTQKSFTYFLNASAISKAEDCLTDYEGVSASEDDDELISVFPLISLSTTTDEKTNIKEHFVTGPSISPCVTPDPKFHSKNLLARSPIQAHTDTEFLFSDSDVPFRKRIRNGKSLFDGFLSDAEDSDTSLSDNPFVQTRKASLQYSKVSKSKLNVNIRKKSEPNLTDIEYIDGFNTKGKSKMGKLQKVKNSTGKKNIPTVRRNLEKQKKIKSKNLNDNSFGYLLVKSENEGNTDIEEFDKEDIESDIDIETPVYIPETKSHIVISNQNSKGDVALIIPIHKSSGSRLSSKELNECGYSDVEELQDYCAEETTILCPSPEPPIYESSFVQASESLKENSKLNLTTEACEPLTDTEEININKTFRSKKMFKKKQNQSSYLKPEEINENLTDVEDLVMEKNDNGIESQNLASSQINTDIEDFSDDGINEEKKYPDFDIISSCNIIREKENLGPFSPDMRSKMNKATIVPLIKTISPSPIPYNTEMEDMSGEEDIVPYIQSDDCNLEPHSSTVHIRHSRIFKPKRDELKEFLQQSEPLTDIEEIEFREIENNQWNWKKGKFSYSISLFTKPLFI